MTTRCIWATIAVTFFLAAPRAWPADGDVKLANGVTVPAPAPGFAWAKVPQPNDKPAGKAQVFVATKEGSTAKVVLIVEPVPADTDAKKLARIKGDYNGMVTSLSDQGYTDLTGTKPPLEAPFPDKPSFFLQGKDKDGKTMAFDAVLVFAKSTYHFQVAADSEKEAKALAKVAERIKE